MRMLVFVRMPHDVFNEAVRDGSVNAKTDAILEDIKPESVCFAEIDGIRTVVMVVEMNDSSEIPKIAEPWFLTFEADVEFHVAMNKDELDNSGLESLGAKWGSL